MADSKSGLFLLRMEICRSKYRFEQFKDGRSWLIVSVTAKPVMSSESKQSTLATYGIYKLHQGI